MRKRTRSHITAQALSGRCICCSVRLFVRMCGCDVDAVSHPFRTILHAFFTVVFCTPFVPLCSPPLASLCCALSLSPPKMHRTSSRNRRSISDRSSTVDRFHEGSLSTLQASTTCLRDGTLDYCEKLLHLQSHLRWYCFCCLKLESFLQLLQIQTLVLLVFVLSFATAASTLMRRELYCQDLNFI